MNKLFRYRYTLLAGLLLVAAACEKPVSDIGGQLTLNLRNSNGGPKADEVFVSIKYSGNWRVSVSGKDGQPTDEARITDIKGNPVSSGSGETNSLLLQYSANKEGEDRIFEIRATPEKGEVQTTYFVQYYKDHGNYKEDIFPTGWIELAEKKEGLEFYVHPMTLGRVHSRNYSFCYDKSKLLSWWVAYPLNSWSISTGSRTNAWGYDSKLSPDDQPNLSGAYRTEGYQRGHQCPSADRLNRQANIETFYYTNMTPQKGTFNTGVWAQLEGKLRSWAANLDTLYVVTGCQVDKPLGYAKDNDNKDVAIPSAYFKALVGYHKSQSVLGVSSSRGSYAGIAFWFSHSSSGSDYMAGKMTIDQLEEKLGYDLFVNLPSVVGEDKADEIESSIDQWWTKH